MNILFLFWLFLEKFISFPYWIQNKIIIFLINEMSDTEDSSEWYIKRLGVRFFKLAQMFFIKSSQNFSISFILSIGVRKFFICFNSFEGRTSWSGDHLAGVRGPLGGSPWFDENIFSWIGRCFLWIMLLAHGNWRRHKKEWNWEGWIGSSDCRVLGISEKSGCRLFNESTVQF